MKKYIAATLLSLGFIAAPASAGAFEIGFDWGNIPRCTSGNPNTVGSPAFTVRNAPAGTAQILFKLVDLDVPSYNHGSGVVPYNGGAKVDAGAFRYKSPCPPNGSHTYQWIATAYDAGGKGLARATAERDYP